MSNRKALSAIVAAFIAGFSSKPAFADSLQFGVVGSAIDLSANVSEAILPGNGPFFQQSKPLFGTTPIPKQSAELLHFSSTGVNPSDHSKLSGAFASSLAESNGNGGVGVSQLIFGSPGSGLDATRQLAAQSLWTQTFVYNGTPTVDLKLHLQIPALQVELWGIPPVRDNPSFTETAQASAAVDTVITHADGTFSKGGSFRFGLREFETQLPDNGVDLLNFADLELIGNDGPLFASLHEDFDFPQSRVRWRIDSVATDVDLGVLNKGDTLSYVYTLTAEGTTHGFERGYDAFLGDPFGVDTVAGNLSVSVALADVPEASTYWMILLGLASICGYRRWTRTRFSDRAQMPRG